MIHNDPSWPAFLLADEAMRLRQRGDLVGATARFLLAAEAATDAYASVASEHARTRGELAVAAVCYHHEAAVCAARQFLRDAGLPQGARDELEALACSPPA